MTTTVTFRLLILSLLFGWIQAKTPLRLPSVLLLQQLRGGSGRPSSYYGYNPTDPNMPSEEYVLQDQENSYQDQVEKWREYQRQQAAANQYSPRDEQGRMKLLTSVSKGSRALIFFVLMWRNVHLYEVADQTKKGVVRLLFVIPLVMLFIANLAGVVTSITSPSHSAKKRLKAILNLDKFLEVLLIFFYFIRLTVAPSKVTPREQYIACVLHSVFFILQCQAFTKLSWDESAPTMQSYMAQDDSERDTWAERRDMREN